MRSTATYLSRARLAKFYVERQFWLAVGKTSAWPIENTPPLPSPASLKMPEIYGFWYVHKAVLASKLVTGELVTSTGNYKEFTSSHILPDLAKAKAFYVYQEALIRPADLATSLSYRAVAIVSDLTISTSFPSLLPGAFIPSSSVTSYSLEWVATTPPIARASNTNHTIQVVREF